MSEARDVIDKAYLECGEDDVLITITERGLGKCIEEAIQRAEKRGRESAPIGDSEIHGIKFAEFYKLRQWMKENDCSHIYEEKKQYFKELQELRVFGREAVDIMKALMLDGLNPDAEPGIEVFYKALPQQFIDDIGPKLKDVKGFLDSPTAKRLSEGEALPKGKPGQVLHKTKGWVDEEATDD